MITSDASKDAKKDKPNSNEDEASNKYGAQTELSFLTTYVQVQTTWAVLILAFLAGLVSFLAVIRPWQGVWSIAPIVLYALLLFGLGYSAHRFLIATAYVKQEVERFGKRYSLPFKWKTAFYDSRQFKHSMDNVEINEQTEITVLAVTFILFALTLIPGLLR
jgi:hypothetical protein